MIGDAATTPIHFDHCPVSGVSAGVLRATLPICQWRMGANQQ